MMSLRETMRSGPEARPSKPWPRHVVDQTGWLRAIREISKGQGDLLSLWSDGAEVHMAILDHESSEIGLVSFECRDGRFPSVAHLHPPAMRLERAIQDIYGLVGQGLARSAPLARSWTLGPAPSGARGAGLRSHRRTHTNFCRRKARRCIRFRSVPSMPASSSRAISASRPTASSSSASRNGWVTSTRELTS